MKTLTKKVNQYRTQQVNFISFEIPIDSLEVVGFVKNDGVSKMKGLTVFNFDTISYLSTSEKGFLHCVGLSGKQLYQLILKQVKKPTEK